MNTNFTWLEILVFIIAFTVLIKMMVDKYRSL